LNIKCIKKNINEHRKLKIYSFLLYFIIIIMDTFTVLFWVFSLLFITLSGYLLCCNKKSNVFYFQIASGCGIFATSKIGRTFLGLV